MVSKGFVAERRCLGCILDACKLSETITPVNSITSINRNIMICKTYGSSAESSTYLSKPGSRSEMNYKEAWTFALNDNVKDANYGVDHAVSDVVAAYNIKGRDLLAPASAEIKVDAAAIPLQIYDSCRPVIVETHFSRAAAELFKEYFRVLPISTGDHEFFVRRKTDGTCIELCGNPIAGIDLGGRHTKGMYATLRDKLHNLYKTYNLWDFEVTQDEANMFRCDKIMNQRLFVQVMGRTAMEKYPSSITPEHFTPEVLNALHRMNSLRPFQAKEPDSADLYALSFAYDRLFPDLATALGPEDSQKSVFTRYLSFEREVEIVDIPPTIANDPNKPAFSFVDVNNFTEGPTPNFDSFVSRIEEPCREYFMALFYAPMVAESKHRKITWIRSQGFDGKSTLFNALSQYLGGSVVGFFSTNSLKGDFGLEPLIGKRILIMSDCQNSNLLHSGPIHTITGGDIAAVNRKNQKEIHVLFKAMLFVGSNTPPDLRSDGNETTRLAYIPMNPPEREHLIRYCYCDPVTGDPLYEDEEKTIPKLKGSRMESGLLNEMPHILFKCRKFYEKWTEEDLEIKLPPGVRDIMLRDCGSDEEDAYSTFFNTKFEFHPSYSMPYKSIFDKYLVYSNMSTKAEFVSAPLKRYLSEQRGCKSVGGRNKRKGDVTITWGLRLKGSGEEDL